MLPFFKKSEDLVADQQSDRHGVGGGLKVSTDRFIDPIMSSFLEAGEELGYPVGDINSDFKDSGLRKPRSTMDSGRELTRPLPNNMSEET